MKALRGLVTPARLLLAAILLVGFALRVWNIDYGLPFVYGFDEGHHFTSRAVRMFYGGGFDTDYFDNPTAYAYLVHFLLRGMYAAPLLPFQLDQSNVTTQFYVDPTEIWIAARVLAAALCMVGVAGVYLAASRIWSRREGLVAAALLAFAFLPVAYSRVAVTDVGALLGVALGVLGAMRALDTGRLRWYALAGAGAGLAISFKYTAGLVLLPVGIAALARLRRDRWRAVGGLALAAGLALAVFVATNPYALIDFGEFKHDVLDQAEVAAESEKPGQGGSGFSYYLDSLTWGLGWLALLAAAAGAALEFRREVVRGLLLVSMPLALYAYLAVQSRYFGRWLLPAYPVLAMLAAVALVRAAALVRGSPAVRTTALAGLLAAVLVQPVAADIRTGLVFGRDDTRQEARDYLTETYPPELRIVIEPDVPGRYLRINPSGELPSYLRRCAGGRAYEYTDENGEDHCIRPRTPGSLGRRPGQFPRTAGGIRASAWHLVLEPSVIDDYRLYGYCTVMTMDTVRDRALETGRPEVRAYYERLERESKLVRVFSPYDDPSDRVPFNFDLSFNYYPPEYERPGPEVRIYRLNDCDQRYGPSIIQVPKPRELPPLQRLGAFEPSP
jgi:Dolichyl-phosphate-mannose-protein mannosyltransferase